MQLGQQLISAWLVKPAQRLARVSRRIFFTFYVALWGVICFGAFFLRLLISKIAIFWLYSLRRLAQLKEGVGKKNDSA